MNDEKQTEQMNHEFNAYFSQETKSYLLGSFDLYSKWSREELREMICDPMANNQALRALSEIVYNSNGIVTNTIDYMCALPTLDRVVVPYGKKDQDGRREKVSQLLCAIRDRELGRDCLLHAFKDGVAFYYLETTDRPLSNKKFMSDYEVWSVAEINENMKASVITLPPDYTKIVGRKNSSYVLAFDLRYFDEGGGESTENKLRKYPKEIRDAYRKKQKDWVILDNTRTMAIKYRATLNEPWGRPLVLAALQDIFFSDYFVDTKRGVLDEVNNRIYYQTFPEGERKGLSALSEKQQKEQHDAVKRGITQKNNRGGTSFFSVAAGTKIDELDTNIDILDEKNEATLRSNIATSIGFAGSLLSGSGDSSYSAQESNLRLVTAQIFHVLELFANELNKVINACLIRDKKNYVRVSYLPITYANRDDFVKRAKDMYLEGRGSLLIWAAAAGIEPDVFLSIMDYELAMDLDNKYPVHQTSFTQSAKGDNGRPVEDNPTNPNTVASKTNNANSQPKPGA